MNNKEKLNIESLRRNNWVIYSPGGERLYYYPVQIDGYRGDEIYIKNPEYGINNRMCYINELLPIPINEKVLEGLGFEKEYDKYGVEYNLSDFPFTIVCEDNNIWYGGTYMTGRESDWVAKQFNCQYIHELQNILNVSNIEISEKLEYLFNIKQLFKDEK